MKAKGFIGLVAFVGLVGLVVAATMAAGGDSSSKQKKPTPVRVGVYDSRAVAVAFVASGLFEKELQQWNQEKKEAKQEGNIKAAEKIDAKMLLRQKLVHHQGFGTTSVENILQHIHDQLPDIANKAGVDVIVSKWAIAYQADQVEFVDVTDLMIEPFKPSERTKAIIRDLRTKKPVDWEVIEKHDRDR